MSYELRVTSLDIWLKSSVLWVTNSNPQVTSSNSHKLRVQIQKLPGRV